MSVTQEDLDVVEGRARGYMNLRNGTKVEVYACTLKASARALKLFKKVVNHLGIKKTSDALAMTRSMDDIDVMTDMLIDCHDDFINIVADVTNLPATQVADLEADEGIKLILKVFEVNRDFFTKNLKSVLSALPTAGAIQEIAQQMKAGAKEEAPKVEE